MVHAHEHPQLLTHVLGCSCTWACINSHTRMPTLTCLCTKMLIQEHAHTQTHWHSHNEHTQSHTRVQLQSHSQTSTHMHLTWSHTNVTMHSVTWTCWRIRWRQQAHTDNPHWLTERTHTSSFAPSQTFKYANMLTSTHTWSHSHSQTYIHESTN